MNLLLNLAMLIAGIVLVMGMAVYGPVAVWWGLENRPRFTAAVLLIFVGVVVVAAATYTRLFPQCHYYAGILRPTSLSC